MTQAELANKLSIPYQSVSQWERDTRNPKYDTLQRIAAALGVEWTELACGRTVGSETMFFGKPASDFLSEVSSLLLQEKKVLITPSEDGYSIFEISQKEIN